MRRQFVSGAIAWIMLVTVAPVPIAAAPGGLGKGGGNAYGFGYGGGKGGGGTTAGSTGVPSGGGAPLPLIGMTVVGQFVGVGGLLVLWRRRKKS